MGKQWGSEDALCSKISSQLKGTAAPGAQLPWSGQGRGCVCGWGGGRGYEISVCLFPICLGTLCSLERSWLGIREENSLPLHLALALDTLHRAELSRKMRIWFLPWE